MEYLYTSINIIFERTAAFEKQLLHFLTLYLNFLDFCDFAFYFFLKVVILMARILTFTEGEKKQVLDKRLMVVLDCEHSK